MRVSPFSHQNVGRPIAVWLLAHGAGTNKDHPFLVGVDERMTARGVAVVRFDFPFTAAGKRRPDPAPRLEAAIEEELDRLDADPTLGKLPRFLGGKSMGGRMASHVVARGRRADGLVFLGYPLHPAGKPGKLRDAHLPRVPCPMLFVSGTRDALARIDLLRRVADGLGERAELFEIKEADHSFRVPKRTGLGPEDVLDRIADRAADWIHTVVERSRA